eukprot:TRINITY_DN18400_c0_g1_i1.p1 TRINITY_DN18400_c0_g1~~TRINITY_DN18400_c0_g1_i1.p1  ORF type:complete len:354 (+),score=65.30 TRINITY_DN18400_c0_g1_i1:191-1252(+)
MGDAISLSEFNSLVAHYEHQHKELQEKCSTLWEENERNKKQRQDTQTELHASQSTISRLNDKVRELEAKLAQTEDEVKRGPAVVDECAQKYDKSIKDIRANIQANDPRIMAANSLQAAYDRTCNELKVKLNEERAAHDQLKARMETDLVASTGERAQAARWKAHAEKAEHDAGAYRAQLDNTFKELERERVVNKHMADALQELQRKAHVPSMSDGSYYSTGHTTTSADRPSAPSAAYMSASASGTISAPIYVSTSASASTPIYASASTPIHAYTSTPIHASTSAPAPIHASSYVPTTPVSLPSLAPSPASSPSTSVPSATVDPAHFSRLAGAQHAADDMACYSGQNDIKMNDR